MGKDCVSCRGICRFHFEGEHTVRDGELGVISEAAVVR